jgi:hypothetical protein
MSSVIDISGDERERIRLDFYRAHRAQDGVSSVGVRRDRRDVWFLDVGGDGAGGAAEELSGTRGSRQARSWRRERRRASGPTPLALTSRSISIGPGDCVYPAGLNRYGQPHEVGSYGATVGSAVRWRVSRAAVSCLG